MKYFGNCWKDLHQIHMQDVFGPSLVEFEDQGQRSKLPGTKRHFWPFWQPACLCLV